MSNRNNRFDSLRLAAASLVIISHSWPLFGHGREPIRAFTGYYTGGEIAVAVFFVISGFLIYRSAEQSESWKRFAVARLLRIVPAVAVCTLLTVFVLGAIMTSMPVSAYFSQVDTWAYLRNIVPWSVAYRLPGVFGDNPYPNAVNGSLWTLPLELRHYVICGFAYFLFRKRWVLPGLALLGLASAGVAEHTFSVSRGTTFWLAHFGWYFFAGASLYAYRAHVPMSSLLAIALFAMAIISSGTIIFRHVIVLAIPYVTIWLAFSGVPQSRQPFSRMPDISYGLYIYGFPVQQVIAVTVLPLLSFWAAVLLALVVTALCAVLSWHLIEKPALRLKPRAGLGDRDHDLTGRRALSPAK